MKATVLDLNTLKDIPSTCPLLELVLLPLRLPQRLWLWFLLAPELTRTFKL